MSHTNIDIDEAACAGAQRTVERGAMKHRTVALFFVFVFLVVSPAIAVVNNKEFDLLIPVYHDDFMHMIHLGRLAKNIDDRLDQLTNIRVFAVHPYSDEEKRNNFGLVLFGKWIYRIVFTADYTTDDRPKDRIFFTCDAVTYYEEILNLGVCGNETHVLKDIYGLPANELGLIEIFLVTQQVWPRPSDTKIAIE